MFNRKKKSSIDPNTTDTLIGEGTAFNGNIKSEASIRIEGRITGDIECKGDVIIGEKGVANSSISARNIIIAGTVHGNVTTTDKLTINSSGKLNGNTSSKSFIIDDGGSFTGNSKMATAKSSVDGQKPEKESSPQNFDRNYNDSASNM